jgi:3-hydroxyacyl-[acyl-carrier-protein] dehydratase
MRWFWIDRFTDFVSGKYATAVKNVSLSEEPLDEYTPGAPVFPAPLIIEGFAQMGGLLIHQLSDFVDRLVLAKVNRAEFYDEARPGDQIVMRVDLTGMQEMGGVIRGTAQVREKPFCEVELTFAYLNTDRFLKQQLFEPAGFCRMLRLLRLFEVGRYEDGRPILIPEHLQAAERGLGITATGSRIEISQ